MIKVDVEEGVYLLVMPSSPRAPLARLSPHQLLQQVGVTIAAMGRTLDHFDDWFDRALSADPDAREDLDELFVAYRAFCDAAGVPLKDCHTFATFGRALTKRGLKSGRDGTGRPVRIGRRLRMPAELLGDGDSSLELFLAEVCDLHDPELPQWTKASALHLAYCAWAERWGASKLSARALSLGLVARGIEKKVSDGVRYGIQLRELSAPPRAPQAMPAKPSEVGKRGAKCAI